MQVREVGLSHHANGRVSDVKAPQARRKQAPVVVVVVCVDADQIQLSVVRQIERRQFRIAPMIARPDWASVRIVRHHVKLVRVVERLWGGAPPPQQVVAAVQRGFDWFCAGFREISDFWAFRSEQVWHTEGWDRLNVT